MSARQMGEILGVSRECISGRMRKLGLRKTKIPYEPVKGEILKEIKEAHGYGVTNKSRVVNLIMNTLLMPKIDAEGYLRITMFPNGNRLERRLHRLVAEYFIPNPDNLPYINHIDGNKTNADIHNLEWITPLGNNLHDVEHDLIKTCENAKAAKMTNNQAISILSDYRNGISVADLQKKYPFATRSMIQKLCYRIRWKKLDDII